MTYEYSKETVYSVDQGVTLSPIITVMMEGSEFTQAPTDLPNGSRLYILDWATLDSGTQSAIGSQVLLWAEKSRKWCKA